ncbi:Hypothetical predicted protein [Cloeon dipterum]|uniref:Uncharacterized protein n=1 Tax=Cloeon dipterum TaxID=197152 RepID=A0A8S1DNP3_9INSE|nr:Hypothetical predicted protein [Cloeon dipterum]
MRSPRVYQARINLRVGKGRAEDLKIPVSERSGCCQFLPVSAVAERRRVLWSRTERGIAVWMRSKQSHLQDKLNTS